METFIALFFALLLCSTSFFFGFFKTNPRDGWLPSIGVLLLLTAFAFFVISDTNVMLVPFIYASYFLYFFVPGVFFIGAFSRWVMYRIKNGPPIDARTSEEKVLDKKDRRTRFFNVLVSCALVAMLVCVGLLLNLPFFFFVPLFLLALIIFLFIN